MRRRWALALGAFVVMAALGSVTSIDVTASATAQRDSVTATVLPEDASPPASLREVVDHLVIVMQQNHTYDSYFGHYPRGRGYRDVTSWPSDADGETVEPFLWTPESVAPFHPDVGAEPLSNGPNAAHMSYDDGTMNGFVKAQDRRGFPGRLTMATHDGTTAPTLWQLADEFVLLDHYFSSAHGGSMVNLLHLFTGDDHGISAGTPASLAQLRALDPPTVFDRFAEGGLSWNFYTGLLDGIGGDRIARGHFVGDDGAAPTALYWAPFLALPRFWTDYRSSLRSQEDFYVEAAQGSLPSLSVVLPRPTDHSMNVKAGHGRLRSIINALMKSPNWERAAVLVVWDEWGGYYDHVPPPDGSGFRVPMLVVSPWARQGHIESSVHDHNAVLEFVLDHFQLPALSQRHADRASFEDVFDLSAGLRQTELLAGELLPAPPVGTSRQNSLTLRMYLAVLGTVALLGGPVAWWVSRRSSSVPVRSVGQLAAESQKE